MPKPVKVESVDSTSRPQRSSPKLGPGTYFIVSGHVPVYGFILEAPDLPLAVFPNRRQVKAFSSAAPTGERGMSLTDDMVEISEAEFDAARRRGWT